MKHMNKEEFLRYKLELKQNMRMLNELYDQKIECQKKLLDVLKRYYD